MVGYMEVLRRQIEDDTKELTQIRENIMTSGLQACQQYRKFYKLTKNELEAKKKKLASMKRRSMLLKMAKSRGVAFVTLEEPLHKRLVFRAYQKLKHKGCLCFFRHKVKHNIYDPPEPTDIRWHTIGYSRCHKIAHGIGSNIVFVLLIPFFVAMDMCLRVFLYIVQNWLDEKHQDLLEAFFYGYSLIVILSGMVRVFGMLADKVFNYLNDLQKMLTVNGLYTSHTIKNAFFKLFLYIGAAASSVGLSLKVSEGEQRKILPFFSSIFMFMVVGILIDPIMDLFNPAYIVQRQKMARIEEMYENGSYLEDKKLSHMTQQELNEIFTRPDPKIQDRYSKALIVVLAQAFFLPFIPFIAIFACISLFTCNLATRYVLYRRTKRPLCRTGIYASAILSFTLIIPPFLNLFNLVVFGFYSALHWGELDYLQFIIKLVILGVNTYPMGFLFKICIQKYYDTKKTKKCIYVLKYGVGGNGTCYTKNSHLMFDDYDRMNPMTQRTAKDEWSVDKNVKSSLEALEKRSRRYELDSNKSTDGGDSYEGGEEREELEVSLVRTPTEIGFGDSEVFRIDEEQDEDGEEEGYGEEIGDDMTEAAR